jgi:hypothetical protein
VIQQIVQSNKDLQILCGDTLLDTRLLPELAFTFTSPKDLPDSDSDDLAKLLVFACLEVDAIQFAGD